MHQDKNININGVNIRYRDTGGSGMPVLMTHGIGGSLELWMPQLEAANDQIRMIAWDMPGHGLSDLGLQPYDVDKFAAFACLFIEALNLKKLVLAGNSLGGAVSARMADLTPERIAGVILLNAATMGRETLIPFRLMTLPVLGEVMTKPSKAGVERQIKAIFMHASVATNEVRQVIERNTFKTGGNKAFLATLRAMTTFSGQNSAVVERTLNILRSIKCPLLFIHGRHDTVIPVKHSIDAQSIVTNSKLLILEDCGHTPQMEKPVEINSALRNFLLSLEK